MLHWICVFVTEANMANLTISVDEDVLKRARIRASEENTSVNAVLGGYLREFLSFSEFVDGVC